MCPFSISSCVCLYTSTSGVSPASAPDQGDSDTGYTETVWEHLCVFSQIDLDTFYFSYDVCFFYAQIFFGESIWEGHKTMTINNDNNHVCT